MDEPLVYRVRPAPCDRCGALGRFVVPQGIDALCLRCAGYGGLVFLRSGNATLTLRARRASSQCLIVYRMKRGRRGRYGRAELRRCGVLVEPDALARVERDLEAAWGWSPAKAVGSCQELQNDVLANVTELYPSCPPDDARVIAEWIVHKARARNPRIDVDMIERAVEQHARVHRSEYVALRRAGHNGSEARFLVRREVREVLAAWRLEWAAPPTKSDPPGEFEGTPMRAGVRFPQR